MQMSCWSSASNKGSSTSCHTLNHKACWLISEHPQDTDIAENLSMLSWYITAQIRRKWLLNTEICTTPELTIRNGKTYRSTKNQCESKSGLLDIHYGWIKSQLVSAKPTDLFHTPWRLRSISEEC